VTRRYIIDNSVVGPKQAFRQTNARRDDQRRTPNWTGRWHYLTRTSRC
jgi:hypothetical protein